MKRLIFSLLALIAVAGCANRVESHVTTFHKLEKNASGDYGTYFVFIPEGKKTSLEFSAHVDTLKKELNKHGFQEQSSSVLADYRAFFSYSVLPYTSSTTTSTPQLQGNSAFAKGFNSVGQSTSTTTNDYLRTVLLTLAKYTPELPAQPVYEGTLVSVGSNGQISKVMPVLIQSLFQNFPGNSGKTSQVELPLEN